MAMLRFLLAVSFLVSASCVDGRSSSCEAQCDGVECGDNGCGGVCGVCSEGAICQAGTCATCTPSCEGKSCGDNGCGGICGTCGTEIPFCQEGVCVAECTPDCAGKTCGDDGCGGSCGSCEEGIECIDGACQTDCTPNCEGLECGDDGCNGTCGQCENGMECLDGICEASCVPSCEGLECGDDGCNGTCGECGPDESCVSGLCEGSCAPSCEGLECGDDGCNGTCGDCDPDEICESGLCQAVCNPACDGLECGDDGCGSVCGTCLEGETCSNAGQCESACQCGEKQCGPGIGGCSCGECEPGLVCSPAGECVENAGTLGSWCGATVDCPAYVDDPLNPGEKMWNPNFGTCRHLQCDSQFCLGAGAPGVWFNMPVCSTPCDIIQDSVNNKTGAPGPDGIEDPNVAFSDCANFSDGPAGANYKCASFAAPGSGLTVAYCVPGTHFSGCSSDADCPETEQCMFSTLNGELGGQRCMAKVKGGPWGEAKELSEGCNAYDLDEGALSYCASGWCFGLGCVSYCKNDSDCDTTKIFPGTGCVGGQCGGWPGKNCSSDADCSAWECMLDGFQIFSDLEDYTPKLCWPKTCDLDADCAPGFYCRYNFMGDAGPDGLPIWENICLAQIEDGAELGDECSDGEDGDPVVTCQNEDMCIGGNCSNLCATNAECGEDQLCTVYEFSVDTDDDGASDQSLPIQWCYTFEGSGTDCLSAGACPNGEVCDVYEAANWMVDPANPGQEILNPDGPYVLRGSCVTVESPESKGETGASCYSYSDCIGSFCLGADEATNTPGSCTETCTKHADCPSISDGEGGELGGVCNRLLYANGGDWNTAFGNVYVGLCQSTEAQGGECGDDFTCPVGEACSAVVITFGPDYAATVDYTCLKNENEGGPAATGTPKDTCDPTLEDFDGNAIAQCVSGLCFEGVEDAQGYCSQLCDPQNDNCATVGTLDMICDWVETIPRKGVYEANSGGFHACRRDIDCTPCFGTGFCPGDRVCANLGQDAGFLADWRCVPKCGNNADCAGAQSNICSATVDGYGEAVKGCFDLNSVNKNYCN